MSKSFFAYIVHSNGEIDDTYLEYTNAVKKIDPEASVTAVVFGHGDELDKVANEAANYYSEVWKVDKDSVAYPNAEVIRPMLLDILPKDCILLLPHNTFGMDLGPGLSIKLDSTYVPDVVDFEKLEGDKLIAVRQEFGGQVSTHVECDVSAGAVITIRPGSFQTEEEPAKVSGSVVDKSADVNDVDVKRKFVEVIEAEVGDVDISKEDVLVSIGRGIGDQENIPIAEELAETMGAVVSCSRPVVDAKWMDKSRQVGTSGKTVKPKVYIAMGISGSFQHMGGIKGNPFIVAVNKNPKAPIFQYADVGVVADLLEFAPVLAEKIKEIKG